MSRLTFYFDDPSDPWEFVPRINSSGGTSFVLIDKDGNFTVANGKPAVTGVHGSLVIAKSSEYDPDADTHNPKNEGKWVAHDLSLKINDGAKFFHDVIGFDHQASGMLDEQMDKLESGPKHLRDRVVYFSVKNGVHHKGDFNGDFARDPDDLDILTREANMRLTQDRAYNWYLDWDGDGDIDQADVKKVMQDANAFNTKYGDLNADGNYTAAEQTEFFTHFNQSGKSWATGDFNGDGNCDNADFQLVVETL